MKATVERRARNVHYVIVDASRSDFEFRVLLTGDRHLDNAESNHAMQLRHLREAQRTGGGIIDVGDVFDAMQGRNDPRRQKGAGRQSAAVAAYLDAIVREASDMLAPFSRNFIIVGRGNHETSILKHCETDLTERLCERMSMQSGATVHAGGYGGWVRFVFRWSKNGSIARSLHYFHGSGGGGMMSHGTLQTRRIASWTPDADIIVGGHTHDQWYLTLARQRLGWRGQVYLDEQHHVRTPSYKDEFGDGFGGWHVERGAPPKPIGAWWMVFRWSEPRRSIGVEFTRAC
jgi:hypothetical protein